MWQCYHKFCIFVLFIFFLVLLWAYVSGNFGAMCPVRSFLIKL